MRSSTGEITQQLQKTMAQDDLIINLPANNNKLSERGADIQTPTSDDPPSQNIAWKGTNVTIQLASSPDNTLFVHKPRKASSRTSYTTSRSAIFIEQNPLPEMNLDQPLLDPPSKRRSWWCCLNFCCPKKRTEARRDPEQQSQYIPPRSTL